MNRRRLEADVEGAPALELRDEDREPVSDLLADMLIEALERPSDRVGGKQRNGAGALTPGAVVQHTRTCGESTSSPTETSMAKVRVGFSDAPILRWASLQPGTRLEVKLHGVRQGEYGALADVEMLEEVHLPEIGTLAPGAPLTLPVVTALALRFKEIKLEARPALTLVYGGMRKSKKGERHAVTLFTDEEHVITPGVPV